MAQATINVGIVPDDGTGDTVRAAFIKVNDNFTELYGAPGVLATVLAGFAVAGTRTTVAATDTILAAFGKVQKWLNDLSALAFSGNAADLAGTKTAAFISDFSAAVAATAAVTANTAKVTNATHTGDATGDVALTIAANAVTNAKAADMATATLKGRVTAAAGDPEDLTGTQATTLLDSFTSALKGLVPASGGGASNFLRADGVFVAPSGSGPTRIAGASGAAGVDFTLQKLTADAAANSTTTLATVMTTTGLGVGVWRFQYSVIYQAAATTTGVDFAINHTGAVSSMVVSSLFTSTGGAAATGLALQVGTNTANMAEGKSARALNTKIGSSLGVDVANANMLMLIEGTIVVTTTGSLELKHASEVAAASTVKAGTNLVLTFIG